MILKQLKSHIITGRLIEQLYLLIFLLTPLLMFHKTSELFEFNKMLFIYTISLLILVAWILRASYTGSIIVQRTVFNRAFFLLLLWTLVSTFTSIDPHTSLYGYYGRFNGGLLSGFAYSILFFGFVSNLTKDQAVRTSLKIFHVTFITSVIVIIWGLFGFIGYDLSCLIFTGSLNNNCWTAEFLPSVRMFSTLGQPNWLAAYLSVSMLIVTGLFMTSRVKKETWHFWSHRVYGLLSLFLFSGVLLTRSRSGLLATGVALAIGMLTAWRYRRQTLKEDSTKIFFMVLFLLVIFLRTGSNQIDRLLSPPRPHKAIPQQNLSIEAPTESFQIRKIVWKGALDIGKKHPIFGTGPETFGYAYFTSRPIEHNNTSEWDFLYNKAHNEYLNTLATMGITGLLIYIFFIVNILIWAVRIIGHKHGDDRIFFTFLISAWCSILISNFFGFSTSVTSLYFYLLPAFMIAFTGKQKFTEKSIKNLKLWRLLGIFILIFGAIFLLKYFLADLAYARADSLIKSNKINEARIELENALKLKQEHIYEDRLSQVIAQEAFTLSLSGDKNYQDLISDLITQSELHNEKSISSSKKNVLYLKTKARNNYIFYQIDKDSSHLILAISTLDEAKKLSPTDPKIPYTMALFYSTLYEAPGVDKAKYAEASLRSIDAAIKLKPNYKEAYVLKSNLYAKFKQKDKARQVLMDYLEIVDPNDTEIKEAANEL